MGDLIKASLSLDVIQIALNMAYENLIACHDCDALLRKPDLSGRQSARCPRCGTKLYHASFAQIDRISALTAAALIMFIIAQAFPIVDLDAKGMHSRTSLFGALVVLWQQEMQLVAIIVFCSTILFPLTEMIALLYVLLSVRSGHIPPGFNRALRAIQFVRPWGMIEVFMLGILITLVKMASLAYIIPEAAIFAFGALTLMFTAVVAFDPQTLWDAADRIRNRPASTPRGTAETTDGCTQPATPQ